MSTPLREPTPKQRASLTWMVALAIFAAGVWFDRFPTGDVVLAVTLVVSALIVAWIWRPPTWFPRTSGVNETAVAGPAELLPNLLTASRSFFGVGVGLALWSNEPLLAYALYLGGNTTDVLDGMMARALSGRTAWGKNFDGGIDALFNSLTGLGILWVCMRSFPTVDWMRLTPLLLNVVGFAIAQVVWGPNTAPAKLVSGALRVILLAVLLSLVPSESRMPASIIGGLLMAGGYYYEYLVMQNERRATVMSIPSSPT